MFLEKQTSMEWLKIATSNEIIRISSNEIVFIKGDGNYSNVYLCNGKEENVMCQLHELMDRLASLHDSPFCRVGKCFIVNKNYIFKVNPGLQKLLLSSSALKNDIQLKISKEALKSLKNLLEKEGGKS